MPMETSEMEHSRQANVAGYSLLGISVTWFVVCLFLPAYTVSDHATKGYEVLLGGWLGILYSMAEWYANPLLFISWGLAAFRLREASFMFSAAAFYLAISFISREQMIVNEAPTYERITSLGAGYWMWIASIGVAVLASAVPIAWQAARGR